MVSEEGSVDKVAEDSGGHENFRYLSEPIPEPSEALGGNDADADATRESQESNNDESMMIPVVEMEKLCEENEKIKNEFYTSIEALLADYENLKREIELRVRREEEFKQMDQLQRRTIEKLARQLYHERHERSEMCERHKAEMAGIFAQQSIENDSKEARIAELEVEVSRQQESIALLSLQLLRFMSTDDQNIADEEIKDPDIEYVLLSVISE